MNKMFVKKIKVNPEAVLLNNDLINLLDSINMPIIMMGTDLVIRRITPQAKKTLNIIPSDIGRPISKIKLNIDIPDLEKTLMDVMESLHPKTLEIKGGEGNWYSVYIRPDRTIDNKIDGVVMIFVDITDRRKAEEDLKNAMEIKSKFTSMVSHELRSPLGAIKEGINLVLECLVGDLNDEQKDLLDTAKKNVDRLSHFINNVLDFQKLQSGKIDFDIQENNINEVALDVKKTMELLGKEKGLDCVANLDENMPKVRFDKDKIIQVLTNLMSNSIKYTEKGNITISTKHEDNVARVTVQDTGLGIKSEYMERLFQDFELLDKARDRKKGGTGLGLAISKEIILAHHGKIWAESEKGKGSAFHFTLPIKERRG